MYSNGMNATGNSDADSRPAAENRLGTIIRAKRRGLGLTQKQVESRSGGVLSQNYQSQVERGEVGLPGFEMLEAFAAALGLPLNDLKIAAGYPVVRVPAFGEIGASDYYDQLWAQAKEELALEDWQEIEAMLERRREERRHKE